MRRFVLILLSSLCSLTARGNTRRDQALPISHCYHWLNPAYLEEKIKHANAKGGEISFYTTGAGGAQAGPGLYCAKSPSQSHTYGERVIRIDFVEDVVIQDEARSRRNYCGSSASSVNEAACQSKEWDLKLYRDDIDYYVIKSPAAILRWTAASEQLLNDLAAEIQWGGSDFQAKAARLTETIRNEMKGKGDQIYWNPLARGGSTRLLVGDERALQGTSAIMLMNAVMSLPAGHVVAAERLAWIRSLAVQKIMVDDKIRWSDVEKFFRQDSDFRQRLWANLPTIVANRPGGARLNLAVGLALDGQDQLPQRTADQIVDLILDAQNLSTELPPLRGQRRLVKALEEKILTQVQRLRESSDLKGLIQLSRFIDQRSMNNELVIELERHIKSLLPGEADSQIFLFTDGSKIPIGNEKTFLNACLGQVYLNRFKGNDVKVFYNGATFDLGPIGAGSDGTSACQNTGLYLAQVAALKGTGAKDVIFVSGVIDYIPYRFAVSDGVSLEAAITQFVALNSQRDHFDRFTMTVKGTEAGLTSYGNGWTPNGLIKAFTLFGTYFDIRSPEQREYEDGVRQNQKNIQVKTYLKSEGLLVKFNITTDSLDTFTTDCAAAQRAYHFGRMEKAYVQVNRGAPNEFRLQAMDDDGMCSALRIGLLDELTSGASLEKVAKYTYKFLLDVPGVGIIPMGGNHLEDVRLQCRSTLANKSLKDVRHLAFHFETAREWKAIPVDQPLQLEPTCNRLLGALQEDRIPSLAQYQIEQVKGKYSVHIRVGRQRAYFSFSSAQQLESQCLSVLQETDEVRGGKLTEISLSERFGPSGVTGIYLERETRTKLQICRKLVNTLWSATSRQN